MSIAFFDFDHTLTTKDSMIHFVKFHKGIMKWFTFIVKHAIVLLKYKLGLVSGKVAKEALLTYFYKGITENELISQGNQFVNQSLESILNETAIAKLQWHLEQQHRVVIVTASLRYWLQEWADKQKIEIITTEVQLMDGKLTGKLKGENCNYEEKVMRINNRYDLSVYQEIYAYGNSKGDLPMLNLATKPFFRTFN